MRLIQFNANQNKLKRDALRRAGPIQSLYRAGKIEQTGKQRRALRPPELIGHSYPSVKQIKRGLEGGAGRGGLRGGSGRDRLGSINKNANRTGSTVSGANNVRVFASATAAKKAFNRGLNRALAGKKLNARQKLAVGAAWNRAIKRGGKNPLTQAIFGGNTNAKYGTKQQKATLRALANAGRGASRVASGASRLTRNAKGKLVIKRVGIRFRPKAIARRQAARRR